MTELGIFVHCWCGKLLKVEKLATNKRADCGDEGCHRKSKDSERANDRFKRQWRAAQE